MVDASGGSVNDYAALRDWKTTAYIKNVCTYQVRVRVTTWVCRGNVPVNTFSDAAQGTLPGFFAGGFSGVYAPQAGGATAVSANSPSSTIFMNPLWCQYFKATKVYNTMLMPYRTITVRTHMCKKPVWLWKYGNANFSNPVVDGPSYLAISRSGGLSTVIKTVEFLGETINDAGNFNPPDVPNVFNAPMVLQIQYKTEFEAAAPQYVTTMFTAGDPPENTIEAGWTGQPWNYMFPVGGTTNSQGTSSIAGALTAGI